MIRQMIHRLWSKTGEYMPPPKTLKSPNGGKRKTLVKGKAHKSQKIRGNRRKSKQRKRAA